MKNLIIDPFVHYPTAYKMFAEADYVCEYKGKSIRFPSKPSERKIQRGDSLRNKPVITWSGSKERNHIEILGEKGLYYSSPQEMIDRMYYFEKQSNQDWNCYRDFNPGKVMAKFKEIYL